MWAGWKKKGPVRYSEEEKHKVIMKGKEKVERKNINRKWTKRREHRSLEGQTQRSFIVWYCIWQRTCACKMLPTSIHLHLICILYSNSHITHSNQFCILLHTIEGFHVLLYKVKFPSHTHGHQVGFLFPWDSNAIHNKMFHYLFIRPFI